MSYRLWFGLAQTESDYRAMKPQWRPKTLDSMHDALWWAMGCNDRGEEIAWEIEGDDGSRLNRQQIADAVRSQSAHLIANPPRKY
jgi:hypothetical protein